MIEVNRKKILVVDDEQMIRDTLSLLLKNSFEIETLTSGEELLGQIVEINPDLVFLDLILPGMDGLETLKKLKAMDNQVPVVMLSGSNTVKSAVTSMKLGAVDYVHKPFDVEELSELIANIFLIKSTEKSLPESNQHKVSSSVEIIGKSPAILAVLDKVKLISGHKTTALISGESGTGKELIARQIHNYSANSEAPFIALNCAAIPENLIEAELFGYEKGAFTGADQVKLGLVEMADQGTLFLDEIGELPLNLQVKLLRFLQGQEFFRLGSSKVRKVDVRIITATNQNLEKMVEQGTFRQDLFYRINVVHLELPALRSRGNDWELIADYFHNKFSYKYQKPILTFSPESSDVFKSYAWPGNVRELENVLEGAYALSNSNVIELEHLPARIRPHLLSHKLNTSIEVSSDQLDLLEAGQEFEKAMIEKALLKTNNVQTKAADLLGISRRILKYKMDKLGIKVS